MDRESGETGTGLNKEKDRMENKESKQKTIGTSDDDSIYRLTVTKEAGEMLERLVQDVNQGTVACKVSRQDVASWFIQKYAPKVAAVEIKEIRLNFLTDQALLRYYIETQSAGGQMSTDLRQLLLSQCGFMDSSKKPSDKKVKDKLEAEPSKEAV